MELCTGNSNFRITALLIAAIFLSSVQTRAAQTSSAKEYCSSSTGNVGNGYHFEYWSEGGGSACMTVYGVDATFTTNWSNSGDFLARVGLRYDETKTPDEYGFFSSDFEFTKTPGGGMAYIGIYGWTSNPLVEYYIIEDWWSPWNTAPSIGTKRDTITIDSGTYIVYQNQRTGPSIHGDTTFTQYYSIRQKGRQSGHTSISQHFAKWDSLGMKMGKLYEVKLLAEGMNDGSGTVDFTKGTVTVSSIAGAPQLVTPGNNSTAQPVNLDLAWNVVSGATTYHLQVSTNSDFSTCIIDDSTLTLSSKSVQSLLQNTAYYWRVNAKNAGGVSAWSEVWSFRTVPPIAGVPQLVTPGNASTAQPVNLDLAWNAVSGATTYRLQLSTLSDFSTCVIDDSTLTLSSKSVQSLLQNTAYYWRVNSKNAGGVSAWSEIWSFSTVPPIADVPQLVKPGNNSIAQPVNLDLVWNAVSGAATYRLQISTLSDFSTCLIDDSTLTLPSKPVQSLLQNTAYYWRVNAKNSGGSSSWSEVWIFKTILPLPGQVTLIAPGDNKAFTVDSVFLIWKKEVPDVDKYALEIYKDSLMADMFFSDSSIVDTFKICNELINNVSYYWRVKAHNSSGWGSFSLISSFSLDIPTTAILPTSYSLNLINSNSKWLCYTLPISSHVNIKIYNIQGKIVYTYSKHQQNEGVYKTPINIPTLSKGNYILVFQAGTFSFKKMFLNF